MKSPIRYSKVAAPQAQAKNTSAKTAAPTVKPSATKTPVAHRSASKKK